MAARPPPKPLELLSDDDPLWSKMRKIISDEAAQEVTSEQGPRTLVEYDGPLCLDTFVAGNGGVVFYNPSQQVFDVEVQPSDAEHANQQFKFSVLPAGDKLSLVPMKLKRVPYVIVVTSKSSGKQKSEVVDLSTGDSFRLMTLGADGQLSNSQLAAVTEKASMFMYHMGAPIDQVVEFNKLAELAYRAKGDNAGVARIQSTVSELAKVEKIAPEWSLPSEFWSQTPEQIIALAKQQNYSLPYIALGLNLAGQYKKAADLQFSVATESLDLQVRDSLLKSAFYGYLAAGDRSEAKSIQRNYSNLDATLSIECHSCKHVQNNTAATVLGQSGMIISTASVVRIP